jgi:diguanylate cyclase (GGDEF)-like protein
MKLTKILIILIFSLSMSLFAVKYPVIIYQNSDGLPQNRINSLIQDRLGYIYVGTQSGIGKFDGNRFEVINKKDGLPYNYINDFAMDSDGNIWVATQKGLARIDEQNRIDSFLGSRRIRSLTYVPSSQTLWVMTEKGLYYYKNNQFNNYTPLNFKFKENDEHHIKGLTVSDDGIMYFYSDQEVVQVEGEKIRVLPFTLKINFLKQLKNEIVVGTEKGVYVLNKDTGNIEPYSELSDTLHSVTDIAIDKFGSIYVATENGLFIYQKKNTAPILIDENQGLYSHQIKKILIDREQNIFIATFWGLAQLSPNLFYMYDESDGLPSKFIWSYLEEPEKGRILIGCNSGIAEFDIDRKTVTPFNAINRKLIRHSIRTITKIEENNYLLGSRERGIYRWDGDKKLTSIYPKAKVLDSVKTPDNIIWFGTDDGLLKYDGKQFRRYRDGLKNTDVWAVAALRPDTLLLGTGEGIQTFHKEKFIPSELEKHIDDEIVVNDIKVISPNEILVATELHGLFIYKDKKLKQLSTKAELLNDDVWAVITDSAGSMWFSTSVSLDRYKNGFISHYNKKTGLFGDEGSLHGIYKDSRGNLYFSITPGFIQVTPDQERDQDIPKPILYIAEVTINGENHNPDDELELKHSQKNIDFHYIAVSTRKENPVLYKTRLSPLDSDWSEPTKETHIKYMHLAPEDYTFEVIANNGGGEDQWFNAINKFSFSIVKPFWLTWWFISIMVLVGAALIMLLIQFRVKHLEHQKKQLEEIVKQRTEEIIEKNKELAYLSVTDPLTDLKNRRYLEEKIKEDISLIERYLFDKRRSPEIEPTVGIPSLGVFILDIDYFKKVNDDYGHKAGDIVIIDIARLLLEMLRHSDTIVRWGGEEFLIITRQLGNDSSFELAERIRSKIENFKFKIDEDTTIKKTISVGFAHFPFIPNDTQSVNWSQVVSLADNALYIAKKNGRNLTVGIEHGEKKLDVPFKDVVSNIKMGFEKKYLKLNCTRSNLCVCQHKI